jgi:aminoglycoside phosphotransferase (APT) family kinase protein
MSPETLQLAQQLDAFLSDRYGAPVVTNSLDRFHGGAARETWRFRARSAAGDEWLVVRRDPPATLIDTTRAVEFHALARAHAAGLPVPEPLFLDATGEWLGAPAFVMRAVEGGRAPGLFEEDPYGATRAATGTSLFGALGRLHTLVPDAADRAVLPAEDAAGRLAHWSAEIARHAFRPEPVAAAAQRWLQRNLPAASGPPAIVHGDFRSGNFLVDDDGRLLALLDWEMAHVGDPMEDLAWAADPLWRHSRPDLVGAMLPEAEMIAAWEATSGRQFAAKAWAWWRLFASFAGLAIWISSAHEVARMRAVDPVLAFAGFYPYRFHNAAVARMLERLAA